MHLIPIYSLCWNIPGGTVRRKPLNGAGQANRRTGEFAKLFIGAPQCFDEFGSDWWFGTWFL